MGFCCWFYQHINAISQGEPLFITFGIVHTTSLSFSLAERQSHLEIPKCWLCFSRANLAYARMRLNAKLTGSISCTCSDLIYFSSLTPRAQVLLWTGRAAKLTAPCTPPHPRWWTRWRSRRWSRSRPTMSSSYRPSKVGFPRFPRLVELFFFSAHTPFLIKLTH